MNDDLVEVAHAWGSRDACRGSEIILKEVHLYEMQINTMFRQFNHELPVGL